MKEKIYYSIDCKKQLGSRTSGKIKKQLLQLFEEHGIIKIFMIDTTYRRK